MTVANIEPSLRVASRELLLVTDLNDWCPGGRWSLNKVSQMVHFLSGESSETPLCSRLIIAAPTLTTRRCQGSSLREAWERWIKHNSDHPEVWRCVNQASWEWLAGNSTRHYLEVSIYTKEFFEAFSYDPWKYLLLGHLDAAAFREWLPRTGYLLEQHLQAGHLRYPHGDARTWPGPTQLTLLSRAGEGNQAKTYSLLPLTA